MKKEITQDDESFYEAKYIISKKKYAIYAHNKNNKNDYKSLSFFKNKLYHRNCDLGPQTKNKYYIYYREKGECNNLYGYAWIDRLANVKRYIICDKAYNYTQFNNYISIYNKLSYKRTY